MHSTRYYFYESGRTTIKVECEDEMVEVWVFHDGSATKMRLPLSAVALLSKAVSGVLMDAGA
jgi:hypothetical protein